ncbi:hypothetical protein FF100_26045 [Methylobacterium terricola]|uniref:Motility protein n=1 Tax=Methylobacterium terricola TaxID=2583531 RepID=A0A5C4LBF4_9HYPH|nr:hypothetical protein [Methylobacterium terricola]TNC09665.1 hypothetical protein FF100_26045 [Methylobacterium terricola]
MTAPSTASGAIGALTRQGTAFSQQVAILSARRQIDAERSVAGLVAQAAQPPAPPGQGRVLDVTV